MAGLPCLTCDSLERSDGRLPGRRGLASCDGGEAGSFGDIAGGLRLDPGRMEALHRARPLPREAWVGPALACYASYIARIFATHRVGKIFIIQLHQ